MSQQNHQSTDKANTYTELAKINAESHRKRRDYEWKLLLGLWAGQALALWFLLDKRIALSGCMFWFFCVAYALGFVGIFLFILSVQRADEKDRRWQHAYMDLAERGEVRESVEERKKGSDELSLCFGFRRPWAWGQLSITFALAAITIAAALKMNDITFLEDEKPKPPSKMRELDLNRIRMFEITD